MTDEVVVDTDVLSRVRLRTEPEPSYARYVPLLQGARLVLAAQTVGELLVWAGWKNWGAKKREHLEALIRTCVVVPVAMDLTRVWADSNSSRRINTDQGPCATSDVLTAAPPHGMAWS